MNNFPPPPYTVELLRDARVEVRRCLREARVLGIVGDYVTALWRIYHYLTTRPHTWGEESHRYRAAKLILRKMIHDRILVSFAVHEEQPVVFVRECRPVLGHPLESA